MPHDSIVAVYDLFDPLPAYFSGVDTVFVDIPYNQSINYKYRRYFTLEDMEEAKIISWICENHPYERIADLCMGKGLVGASAYHNGKSFVGTDINPKRLQVLIDKIRKEEKRKS